MVKSSMKYFDCSDDGTGRLTYDVKPGEECPPFTWPIKKENNMRPGEIGDEEAGGVPS